jgi:hypothetical protein
MSSASLLDHLTPDHGVDLGGRTRIDAGAAAWIVRLDDRDGAVADGPLDAEIPVQVREAVADIKATVAAVRDWLDALFADRREWHCEDFAESYVRHPLTGWLARRLVWTFTTDGGLAIHGFPDPGGQTVATPEGTRHVPAGSLVRADQSAAERRRTSWPPATLPGLGRVAADPAVVAPDLPAHRRRAGSWLVLRAVRRARAAVQPVLRARPGAAAGPAVSFLGPGTAAVPPSPAATTRPPGCAPPGPAPSSRTPALRSRWTCASSGMA